MTEKQQGPTADIDPLFAVDDEDNEVEEVTEEDDEKTAEVKRKLEERMLYREFVINDPFYQEASSSIKRMLSYDVWKSVKSRTPDPDIGDVCLGSVIQRVDVIPDKLVAEFRMINAKEWRYLIDKMTDLHPAQVPNQQALFRLVLGLHTLDGIPVHSTGLTDSQGRIDDARVSRLVSRLEERPLDVLHLLSVHYEWFRARMHLILEGGQVKNG